MELISMIPLISQVEIAGIGEKIFGAALSAVGGGGIGTIVGGLFGIINGIIRIRQSRADHDFELDKMRLDKEMMQEEARLQIEVDKARIQGQVEEAEMGALLEAVKGSETKMFSERFFDRIAENHPRWAVVLALIFAYIDFVRATVRPHLAYYLVMLSTGITVYCVWILYEFGATVFTAEVAQNIVLMSIGSVFMMATSLVSFYAVDRSMAKDWRARYSNIGKG